MTGDRAMKQAMKQKGGFDGLNHHGKMALSPVTKDGKRAALVFPARGRLPPLNVKFYFFFSETRW